MRFYKVLLVLSIGVISCNSTTDNKPKNFDSFWKKTVEELGTTVVSEKIKDSIVNDKKWSLFKIKSYNNIYIHAWVSEPISSGKFPIKIRFSGFGEGETNSNKVRHPWFLKQRNSINMIVDVRGQGLSQEQIKFKGYLTNGLNDKEKYIYRGTFMDAVKAVDFISQNINSDGNIIASGGSQGGALAIVATAFNSKVTMCVIGFPFLTDMENYDKSSWPMNILIQYSKRNDIDYFDLKNTLSYFDILNFTDKINVPIFIRTQETDKITPKESAIKLFEQIKIENKEMYIEPCEGHGCSSKSKKANDLEREFIKKNILRN